MARKIPSKRIVAAAIRSLEEMIERMSDSNTWLYHPYLKMDEMEIKGISYKEAVKACEWIQDLKCDIRGWERPLKTRYPDVKREPVFSARDFLFGGSESHAYNGPGASGFSWDVETHSLIFNFPGGAEEYISTYQRILEQAKELSSKAPEDDMTEKTLFIVSGAARSVGNAFRQKLKQTPNSHLIGIARNTEEKWEPDGLFWQHDNPEVLLLNIGEEKKEDEFQGTVRNLILGKIEGGPLRLVFVYTVGPFEYQGAPELGDKAAFPSKKDLYKLNFTAFQGMTQILEELMIERGMKYKTGVRLDLVGLSTKALTRDDSHLFPAYSITKTLMERMIHNFTRKQDGKLQRGGLTLRTSTLHTDSEGEMRSGADKEAMKYWISPDELAASVCPEIIKMGLGYDCLEVYKFNPNYKPSDHAIETAREKWIRETGGTIEAQTEFPKGADPSLHKLWQEIARSGTIKEASSRKLIIR